jgi:NAD(P)-dependent dehydrogenase (short-subunit alcohol dehydrogenase family)
MTLSGRCAIVTGASQGLGFEVAKHMLEAGASVAICARNEAKLLEAKKALQASVTPNASLIAMPADVSKPKDIEHLVQAALNMTGRIDILVANAGVYGPKGAIDDIDWEAWSEAIDINLKGVVLQCRGVLPHMKKQHYGKIIILSGGGATKPMPNLSAYAASKAAVVRFAETLAEEVANVHIDVNTVAPGALNTRLLDEILEAGPDKVGKKFYEQSLKQKENGGTDLSVGSALCVFLGSAKSDGITGRLLSAVWDPWQTLPEKREALQASDIYTLRRIVPEDRGQQWEVKS